MRGTPQAAETIWQFVHHQAVADATYKRAGFIQFKNLKNLLNQASLAAAPRPALQGQVGLTWGQWHGPMHARMGVGKSTLAHKGKGKG